MRILSEFQRFTGFLPWVAGAITLLATSATGAPNGGFDHAYSRLAVVLDRHVQNGDVDYAALKKNTGELDAYLRDAGAVREEDYDRWSRQQRLAFLINTYNAAVLKLIADHYPVSSIKKIGGWFRNPFGMEFINLFGRKVSLDEIEHGIIRRDFVEPRIHFALVCAARSCPILRREPYVADRLDQQLEGQARTFLNDPTKNRVDLQGRTTHLSMIFKWFGEDFGPDSAAVVEAIKRYWPESVQEALAERPFKVRYLSYDWKLNDLKK